VDDFYAARSGTIPPLPWSTFSPPFSAKQGIKAIIYFSIEEKLRVDAILKELELVGHKDVVLIDARADNKPSGSKA